MAIKRIGILTGGGDVPGLNVVIKSAAYRSSENDIEIFGLRRGWEALTHLNIEDARSRSHYVIQLNQENTRTIDRYGGTVLHTSRTNPSSMRKLPAHLVAQDFPASLSAQGEKTWDVSKQVLANLSALGIEHLIAIGGDDTLGYAAKLNKLGVRIIAIPKTMDNDVHNTEYCIGFSTAITRASDAIERQRTTVGSHERIGVFRVFGRDAGFTALYTAYATSVRCVIPEYRVNLDKLIQLLLEDKRTNPSNYALVVLSEGAEWEDYTVHEYGEPDAYGHRKKASVAELLADEIKRRAGVETIASDLTYDLRSGEPDFIDKLVALTFGNMAYDAILDGKSGLMSGMVQGANSGPQARAAQSGRRHHVQHRTLPSHLREQARATDLSEPRIVGVVGGLMRRAAIAFDFGSWLSFPKFPSDLNWHDEVESLHRQGRCLRSFMYLGCSSPTCSSRVVGLKPRTSFSVIN